MEKLRDAVQKRISYISGEPVEEPELKMFSVRLPLDLLEKIDDIAGILELTKTETVAMLLNHAADYVINEFQITTVRHGMSFKEQYEYESASSEEQKETVQKWVKDAAASKAVKEDK